MLRVEKKYVNVRKNMLILWITWGIITECKIQKSLDF